MNSVQQQHGQHYWKVLIKSFHLNGHTVRFRWTVQDLEGFLVLVKSSFGSERAVTPVQKTNTRLIESTDSTSVIDAHAPHCETLS